MNIEEATGTPAGSGEGEPRPPRAEGAAAGNRTASVEVALATYNSARFLPELLDSLFAQSVQDFTLVIADDGSVDETGEILKRYCVDYPGRVRIIERGTRRLGPSGNFSRLLDNATADYVMLCDHDDVWMPNKISISLARMLEMEARNPPGTPLLVHTDLVIVDEHLEVIHPSFFRYSRIQPKVNHLTRLLMSNVATGCTTIVNRALYERARPVPADAMMHDHWLALVAAALGSIECMDEPTILYRLHGGNAIGVRRPTASSAMERVYQTLLSGERYGAILRYSRQAAALFARFGDEMTEPERQATEALATISTTPRWRRFSRLRRSGLGLKGLVRNIALLIVVTRGAAPKLEK